MPEKKIKTRKNRKQPVKEKPKVRLPVYTEKGFPYTEGFKYPIENELERW